MSDYIYSGYIKTDDIVKYCDEMSKKYELTNPSYSDACSDMGNKCLDLSNDDITEIKHGEWIDKGSLSCRCSSCGCKSLKESNFCPNCGADMRGEGK